MPEKASPPALSDVEAAKQAWIQSKQDVLSAKERFCQSIITLGIQVEGDNDLRDRMIAELYWKHFDIGVGELAEAFGLNNKQIRLIAGAVQGRFKCQDCGTVLSFTSRTQYTATVKLQTGGKWAYSYDAITRCPECKKNQDERDRIEWEDNHNQPSESEIRREYLHTMPYCEYLQTPEWQERRQLHVRSTGYRCQLCNEKAETLNVHHRTYERRGNESFKDLIVLCSNCHAKFHDKLPNGGGE